MQKKFSILKMGNVVPPKIEIYILVFMKEYKKYPI